MRSFARVFLFAICASCSVAWAQQEPTIAPDAPSQRVLCPGSFPTNLPDNDCRFHFRDRVDKFITGYVTDQAIAGAVVYGAMSQVIKSGPSDWGRNWEGYGRRVGVRYNQAVAKGAAEFVVGSLLHDDPRHISYYNDPLFAGDRSKGAGWNRFGHALFDTVTVRHSTIDGRGRRLPAISRFAGHFASAYGGYAWYPQSDNTFEKAGLRAAGSFGASFVSSFYTEYSPELGKLAGAIFKRGRAPAKGAK